MAGRLGATKSEKQTETKSDIDTQTQMTQIMKVVKTKRIKKDRQRG